MLYFEDFVVGQVTEPTATYTINKEELIEIGQRWDPQPFHIDEDAAKDTMFGGLVASSVHLFAIITWFSHQLEEPVAAVSALGFNDLKWHHPVFSGDVLSYKTVCIKARPSNSRPECGIINTANELYNQDGTLLFSMQVSILMSRRNQPD